MSNLMTEDDFNFLLNSPHRSYYEGRWEYFSVVLRMIEDIHPNRVLEIGPGWMPVVRDADLMYAPEEDKFGRPDSAHGQIFIHDATQKPWPFEDCVYDLVVALNVFEHLDNKQSRAFREVMRITRHAILTIPFCWTGGESKWM